MFVGNAPKAFAVDGISLGLGQEVEVDRAWVQRVADRLRGEFGALLGSLPDCRTPAAVAKRLRLQPPMCYRLSWGVHRSGDAAQTLGTFPGVEGLRKVLTAARRVDCPPERLAAAAAAVDEFAALIQRYGGSQTKLVALLRGTSGLRENMSAIAESSSEEIVTRRLAFHSMCAMMGCRAEATVALRIYTEPSGGAGRSDIHAVVGKLGFTRDRHGMPLVFGHTMDGTPNQMPSARLPAASGQGHILEEFCSKPTPRVQVEYRGTSVLNVVDPEQERQEPLDLFVGPLSSLGVNNRPTNEHVLNSVMMLSTPSRWLLSDMYVSRSLMAEASVESGVYSPSMLGRLLTSPTQRWFDRLPGSVPVMLLGRGLSGADSPKYGRMRELTQMLFSHAGLDPNDFVGLRLMVEYPIQGMMYVVSLSTDGSSGSRREGQVDPKA
jgi:hypothetical protein